MEDRNRREHGGAWRPRNRGDSKGESLACADSVRVTGRGVHVRAMVCGRCAPVGLVLCSVCDGTCWGLNRRLGSRDIAEVAEVSSFSRAFHVVYRSLSHAYICVCLILCLFRLPESRLGG